MLINKASRIRIFCSSAWAQN